AASSAAMVMVLLRCLVLHALLNGRVVLLRSRRVSRLQVLRQLLELLADGIRALRRRSRAGLRRLQGREIGLCRGQVTRLQVLSQLLELLPELLHPVLNALSTVVKQ